jgi:hypothetical protein
LSFSKPKPLRSSPRQQLSCLITERYGKGVLKGDLLSQRAVTLLEHMGGEMKAEIEGMVAVAQTTWQKMLCWQSGEWHWLFFKGLTWAL